MGGGGGGSVWGPSPSKPLPNYLCMYRVSHLHAFEFELFALGETDLTLKFDTNIADSLT